MMLFPMGKDRNDRPIYATTEGRYVVDVDYQKNPRTDLRTKYPATDGYYGEPDCHLAEDVTPVFMDDVVATMNAALEQNEAPWRYVLKENRMFVEEETPRGKNTEELTKWEALRIAREVMPVRKEGYSINDIAN